MFSGRTAQSLPAIALKQRYLNMADCSAPLLFPQLACLPAICLSLATQSVYRLYICVFIFDKARLLYMVCGFQTQRYLQLKMPTSRMRISRCPLVRPLMFTDIWASLDFIGSNCLIFLFRLSAPLWVCLLCSVLCHCFFLWRLLLI